MQKVVLVNACSRHPLRTDKLLIYLTEASLYFSLKAFKMVGATGSSAATNKRLLCKSWEENLQKGPEATLKRCENLSTSAQLKCTMESDSGTHLEDD